jgi:hypothetical protein
VDAALNNFGQFVKVLQAKRMAALLVDVKAGQVVSSSFTIPCPMQMVCVDGPQHGEAKEVCTNVKDQSIQHDEVHTDVTKAVVKDPFFALSRRTVLTTSWVLATLLCLVYRHLKNLNFHLSLHVSCLLGASSPLYQLVFGTISL